jgi:integrase
MSLVKNPRSKNWWIAYTNADGKRVKVTSGTDDKAKAQELHDTLKAGVWRQKRLGDKPEYLFDELCVEYLKSELGSKYYHARATMVAYWLGRFSGQPISSLTNSAIKAALPTKLLVEHLADRDMAPATQNRYLSCISKMLSLAIELEWIEHKPAVKLKREPKARIRWLTDLEVARLLAACDKKWLQDLVRFSLATGARASEATGLDWRDVDFEKSHAWIGADRAKSGKARGIPLNSEAKIAIQGRPRTGRVFLGPSGNDLNAICRKSFQYACKRAGLEDLRWHDLRHTFASRHCQAGTPLLVLQQLGGWEDIKMVLKYAHLGASHLARYAENANCSHLGSAVNHKVA